MRPKAAKYYKLQYSWIGRLILYWLLLPIDIHLTLVGFRRRKDPHLPVYSCKAASL